MKVSRYVLIALIFAAATARAQYSQYYMPLLPDIAPKGAIDPLPPDIPASVKAQSVPVQAAETPAAAPAPAAAPVAVAPAAPAAPPPPPDPCADYAAQYEAYVVCKDQMMKIQRMIDARNQRDGVVPVAPKPADSKVDSKASETTEQPKTEAAPAK